MKIFRWIAFLLCLIGYNHLGFSFEENSLTERVDDLYVGKLNFAFPDTPYFDFHENPKPHKIFIQYTRKQEEGKNWVSENNRKIYESTDRAAIRRFFVKEFLRNDSFDVFSSLSIEESDALYDSYADALVKKAKELDWESDVLAKYLQSIKGEKWDPERDGFDIHTLPIAAYRAKDSRKDLWVVVCKLGDGIRYHIEYKTRKVLLDKSRKMTDMGIFVYDISGNRELGRCLSFFYPAATRVPPVDGWASDPPVIPGSKMQIRELLNIEDVVVKNLGKIFPETEDKGVGEKKEISEESKVGNDENRDEYRVALSKKMMIESFLIGFQDGPETKWYDIDSEDSEQNYIDFSEKLVEKAKLKNLESDALEKILSDIREKRKGKLLPVGAYRISNSTTQIWVVVCKWGSAYEEYGHVCSYAYDLNTIQGIGFATCM